MSSFNIYLTLMGLIDRMKEIAKDEGISLSSFEESLGMTRGYIGTLKRRGSSPSVDIVKAIVINYPQYNLNWLITGEGEKRLKEKAPEEQEPLLDQINKKLDKALAYLVRLDMDSNDIKEGVTNTYQEVIRQK